MPQLLDLPHELITLIAQEVGGGELRKDVRNLTLCRKWYDCAKEVFLSGLHLKNIRLHGCDLHRLAGAHSGERTLMHKNTRNLEIRVLGHWNDDSNPVDFRLLRMNDEGIGRGVKGQTALVGNPYFFEEPPERMSLASLAEWHTQVLNPRLYELFADLRRFTFLESLTFEAIPGTKCDDENKESPMEGYLTSKTINSLLNSLPLIQGLKSLTLDLCCEINDDGHQIHMCEQLSKILPRLESVRLRLVCICPLIFELGSDLQASDVKLRNLIVKLHLPASRPGLDFKPRECDSPNQGDYGIDKREDIIRAAQQYLVDLAAVRRCSTQGDLALDTTTAAQQELDHGLELCRISYVEGINICVVDCLSTPEGSMRIGGVPEEFFSYEDTGSPCWFEDEERVMFFGNSFKFSWQPSGAEVSRPIVRRNSD